MLLVHAAGLERHGGPQVASREGDPGEVTPQVAPHPPAPTRSHPHQALGLAAQRSQSRLHTSACAPQKAHAGRTQPACPAPRSLGFLPPQRAALGPPSVTSGHQLASTHCPPHHCSWGSVGRAGHPPMLQDRLFTPKGGGPEEDGSPEGGSKGGLGGSGSPDPTSQSHSAGPSEWWTRTHMHAHFRWRAPGWHTLSVHPAAQVPHEHVPPPWPPAHQGPAQLPHVVKRQSLHSSREAGTRSQGHVLLHQEAPAQAVLPSQGAGVSAQHRGPPRGHASVPEAPQVQGQLHPSLHRVSLAEVQPQVRPAGPATKGPCRSALQECPRDTPRPEHTRRAHGAHVLPAAQDRTAQPWPST